MTTGRIVRSLSGTGPHLLDRRRAFGIRLVRAVLDTQRFLELLEPTDRAELDQFERLHDRRMTLGKPEDGACIPNPPTRRVDDLLRFRVKRRFGGQSLAVVQIRLPDQHICSAVLKNALRARLLELLREPERAHRLGLLRLELEPAQTGRNAFALRRGVVDARVEATVGVG